MKAEDANRQNRRRFLQFAGAAGVTLGSSALPFASHAATDAPRKLKIGVVGSGRIGGTLGGIWVKAGHDVMLSSRDLEHDKALAAAWAPLREPAPRATPPRSAKWS
jgi:8-hydroxy-5-deazaflavin:NADPH oxidoreductase